MTYIIVKDRRISLTYTLNTLPPTLNMLQQMSDKNNLTIKIYLNYLFKNSFLHSAHPIAKIYI